MEGLYARRNVRPFLNKLRMPSFSPSLLIWSFIGAGYYVICFTVLYRLFRLEGDSALRTLALVLLLVVMLLNAIWNYTFFRKENLQSSFVLLLVYGAFAIGLFVCLTAVDRITAIVFLPYLIYMIYSFRWSYALMRLNPNLGGKTN